MRKSRRRKQIKNIHSRVWFCSFRCLEARKREFAQFVVTLEAPNNPGKLRQHGFQPNSRVALPDKLTKTMTPLSTVYPVIFSFSFFGEKGKPTGVGKTKIQRHLIFLKKTTVVVVTWRLNLVMLRLAGKNKSKPEKKIRIIWDPIKEKPPPVAQSVLTETPREIDFLFFALLLGKEEGKTI